MIYRKASQRLVQHTTTRNSAFTLVELLVVMTIFLLVAAISLPTFRSLINDQKVSQASQTIISYIDEARSKAIAEGRFVGIRFERFSNAPVADFQTAACVRLRQLNGVPPYQGDGGNSRVTFDYPTVGATVAGLQFSGLDNQLLMLFSDPSSRFYGSSKAPISNGDLIEFPGGQRFPLTVGNYNPSTDIVPATIPLNAPVDGSNSYPAFHNPIDNSTISYRIHRSPVPSTSETFSFPRGIVIDSVYSGIGIDGNQFAPQGSGPNVPIDLIFGPNGRVESITSDSTGGITVPSGLVFLCVGTTDGVQPATPFSTGPPAPANLMDEDSVWIVINTTTGRSVVAPRAVVSTPTSMSAALRQSRAFAVLSDSLDTTP